MFVPRSRGGATTATIADTSHETQYTALQNCCWANWDPQLSLVVAAVSLEVTAVRVVSNFSALVPQIFRSDRISSVYIVSNM